MSVIRSVPVDSVFPEEIMVDDMEVDEEHSIEDLSLPGYIQFPVDPFHIFSHFQVWFV